MFKIIFCVIGRCIEIEKNLDSLLYFNVVFLVYIKILFFV